MQKILVPTDFSASATKALAYAAEIARKNGASIYLLHADTLEAPMVDEGQAQPLHVKYLKEINKGFLNDLEVAKKSVTDIYPGTKVETVIVKGKTIHAVLEYAEEKQMDIIVMGTSGAAGMREIFIGSVAAGIIGKSKIPVLTIPAGYQMEEPDGILFATNHFEEDKELLSPIVNIAELYKAAIHVAVFVDTDEAKAIDYVDNAKKLEFYLDFLHKAFPGTKFKGELLAGHEFEETVEKYDEKNELDIIAMITYPKNFLERIMGKSMTKKMAFHSTIPLLAIPAK